MKKYFQPSLLNCPFQCMIFFSEEEYHEELEKLGISEDNRKDFIANGHAAERALFDTPKLGTIAVISMAPTGNSLEDLATIVHESVHIWQDSIRHYEEEAPGIEIEAYGIESLCLEFFKKYDEQIGVKSKGG